MKKIIKFLKELVEFIFIYIVLIQIRQKYEESGDIKFLRLALKKANKNRFIKNTGEYKIIFTNYEIFLESYFKKILECISLNKECLGKKEKIILKENVRISAGLIFNSCIFMQDDVAYSFVIKIHEIIERNLILIEQISLNKVAFKVNYKMLLLELVYFKNYFNQVINKFDSLPYKLAYGKISKIQSIDSVKLSLRKIVDQISLFFEQHKVEFNRKKDFAF